jgi:hypothetical protein
VIRWAPIVIFHTFAKCCVLRYYYYVGTGYVFFSSTASHDLRIFTIASIRSPDKEIGVQKIETVVDIIYSLRESPFTPAAPLPLPDQPTVTSFSLSVAPLPTPNGDGWSCRPSSSRSSLAGDDDDGS